MAQTLTVLWCCLGALILDQCVTQQLPLSCATPSNWGPLDSAQYHQKPKPDVSISFMATFVQNFLGRVQPNPFPKELLQLAVNNRQKFQEQETIREVLLYEVGFLVCAAIGLLYIILVPLIGVCLACCRCCGNCGGRMYQEQCPGIHRWRRGLYWALLVTTLIILSGNACMFYSNQSLSVTVELAPNGISNAMDNVQMYLSTLKKQVDTVVNEGIQTTDNVANSLNDLGPSLGTVIQDAFRTYVTRALNSMRQISQVANRTEQGLTQLNSMLQNLYPKMDGLKTRLQVLRTNVNNTLHNPNCTGCTSVISSLNIMAVDTSFTSLNMTDIKIAVDRALQADTDAQMKGKEFLQSIPQRVSNMTRDSVLKMRQYLGDIISQISQVSTKFPIQVLTQISDTLQTANSTINDYRSTVAKAERYRWIVGLVLCCVVLMVVTCNALGLLLGPLGLHPKADPTKRSSSANCGALFLMSGAGFSFLFGWVLMLLVLVLFLLGGNVYTLLCVPIHNKQLFQIIETSGVIQEYKLSQVLYLKTNLSISDVYSDCRRNNSLWNTLHLMEVLNLNDLLNVSKYTGPIENEFQKNITFSGVSLLSSDQRMQLLGFSNMSTSMDFSSVLEKITNFSNTNFNTTAKSLEDLANKTNSTVRNELLQEASDLRQIQFNLSVDIIPEVNQLNSTLWSLKATLAQINGTVEYVLAELEAVQKFLDSNASEIVKSESRKFLYCLMDYFTAYTNWAKRTIIQDVGCCEPVAGAVDTLELIGCSYIVESLNAFWFSLGWCTVFFIPSIIFSVKLAKFYRRMKYSDIFENHIQLTHLPPTNT